MPEQSLICLLRELGTQSPVVSLPVCGVVQVYQVRNFQLASTDKHTIAELRKCRAELFRLIKDEQELGGNSKELRTIQAALRSIEEQIDELGARQSKRSWSYPLRKA